MDPITILAGVTGIGYVIYNNIKKEDEKQLINPSKYHNLCNKVASQDSIFTDVIDKFREGFPKSFVMSEMSFLQLMLFVNNIEKNEEKKAKKLQSLLPFYKTFNGIFGGNIKNCIWTDSKLSKEINELFVVDSTKKFADKWSKFDKETVINLSGKSVMANKTILNLTIEDSTKDGDNIICDNIKANNDSTLMKVDINKQFALLIFSRKQKFSKRWVYDELKTLEGKKILVTIPEINVDTCVDIKKLTILKDKISDIDDIGLDNIISLTALSISAGKKDINKEGLDIINKIKFNFCILHLPSNLIVMAGKIA